MSQGVLVGSDRNQEWLLPWWWDNYCRQNNHPVAFADFGLSLKMKRWCSERGHLVSLPYFFALDRGEVEPETAQKWEEKYGERFWDFRSGWFNKPFACLRSPFDKTIWIDLDCEVLGELQPLFQFCESSEEICIAKDQFTDSYNSGVFVFRKSSLLVREWAAQTITRNGEFRGDQDLLTALIRGKSCSVSELPLIYNWPVGMGESREVIICHWIGEFAKQVLFQMCSRTSAVESE
jgi:hypothetical protein